MSSKLLVGISAIAMAWSGVGLSQARAETYQIDYHFFGDLQATSTSNSVKVDVTGSLLAPNLQNDPTDPTPYLMASDANFSVTFDHDFIGSAMSSGAASFTASFSSDPSGQNPIDSPVGSFESVVYANVLSPTYASGSITIDYSVALAATPLPASAPMFGAALLALGTIGYGLKRKAKAAA